MLQLNSNFLTIYQKPPFKNYLEYGMCPVASVRQKTKIW